MSRPAGLLAAGAAVLLVLAVVVQSGLVSRLPLPGGRPDLVLLVVLAVALAAGSVPGAVVGFAGGLLADAVSGRPLGSSALVLCVAGYLVGLLHREVAGSIVLPLTVTGIAAALVPVAEAAVLGVVGDASLRWPTVLLGLPGAVLYAVLLAPLVIAPVARVRRALVRPTAPARPGSALPADRVLR